MKRLFWDVNVLLDLIDCERSGHGAANELLGKTQELQHQALCSWHALSIIDYIGGRKFGKEDIWNVIRELVREFTIPETGTAEAQLAFQYLSGDYEDAMQIASAYKGRADYIVTHDKKGFALSPVTVLSPEECVDLLGK